MHVFVHTNIQQILRSRQQTTSKSKSKLEIFHFLMTDILKPKVVKCSVKIIHRTTFKFWVHDPLHALSILGMCPGVHVQSCALCDKAWPGFVLLVSKMVWQKPDKNVEVCVLEHFLMG